MEQADLVTRESLQRDWIEGCSGQDFLALVEAEIALLGERGEGMLERVVVIDNEEPLKFAARFFAAVALQVPVALANPAWGEKEVSEFEALLPAEPVVCGSILIPTGGTTGGVKLAIHTWGTLAASARGLQSFLGGGPIYSCCLLPLFHVSGLMQLVRSFLTGGRIRFDDADTEGYCLSLVPTQLQRALRDPDRISKLRAARVVFVGGSSIPEDVSSRARDLGLKIMPVYGMTETAAMVAAIPPVEYRDHPTIGATPIGAARFSIESDGRIRIQTPALFMGYQGREAMDLESGFIVNDEGRLSEDGRLYVLGRVDRLINSGGEKVDPREVEAALHEIEGVGEVLVVGEPDDEWGHCVVAYLVATPSELCVDQIRTALRARIAAFKVPKRIYFVDELPLDSRGKFVSSY